MKFVKRYIPQIYFLGKEKPLELKEQTSETEALNVIEDKIMDIIKPNPNIPTLSDHPQGISHCEVKEIYKIEY